jgi:O-antigen/teichoic acid export membrane protein
MDVTWLFVGCEEMKLPVARNITIKLLQTILIFCLVKSSSDLSRYIWINALCNFVSSICMYPQVHKWVGRYSIKNLNIKRHIKPILALFLPQAASSIYVQFDRTMIGLLSSDISYVSIYDKAESIVKVPLQFVSATTTVMLPRVSNEFANKRTDKIAMMLKEELRFVLLFAIPMMVGLAVISDQLVLWYLGAQYAESGMVIKMLTPTIMAIGMGEIVGSQLLISVDETRGMTVAFGTGAIVNVVFNAMLIPVWNAVGAAIATTFAEILVIIVQCHYAKKYVGKISVYEYLPKKIIAVLVMFIAIVGLKKICDTAWMMPIQIVIGALVYFICLLICKDQEVLDGFAIIKNVVKARKNSKY